MILPSCWMIVVRMLSEGGSEQMLSVGQHPLRNESSSEGGRDV